MGFGGMCLVLCAFGFHMLFKYLVWTTCHLHNNGAIVKSSKHKIKNTQLPQIVLPDVFNLRKQWGIMKNSNTGSRDDYPHMLSITQNQSNNDLGL